MKINGISVIKKDGSHEQFDTDKIVNAITKSAARVMVDISVDEFDRMINQIVDMIETHEMTDVSIEDMHKFVECALDSFNPAVAKSYREYRNYKIDFVHIMDKVYEKSKSIRYIGDKENANTDSALVATKRSLIYNELNKRLYRRFFMNIEERQACRDGYIYVHDQSARLDTSINCCLCRVGNVMRGGFEMGNIWYNEPKTLDTAFDVMGDIILATASQQYGGFTVPEVDKILSYYAEKSYNIYYNDYMNHTKTILATFADMTKDAGCGIPNNKAWVYISDKIPETFKKMADEYAMSKVKREYEQGFQGIEMKLNTVGSSRGDYPFITMTFGLATDRFGKMAAKTFLEVHMKGQGKEGNKKPVLFPKLVFLYDENLHGPGCINEDLFEIGIQCSSKTIYPDWLSLTGDGYVPSIYKKYGKPISPMGCRAFLSPWYERGGMEPADENDVPVFEGRFNVGAVSLNLPMILAKSRAENQDFYELLDYYLEMIRGIHKRTYEYVGNLRASTNPIQFCEGGILGGNLKPSDKVESLLKPMTASFGITALNELQQLYNGKSITEDGEFALEVLQYINDKVNKFKKEDGWLYAIYGTPAENLCFAADTLVQTCVDGKPFLKEIKDIKVGDLVYSYNENEQKVELKKVVASQLTNESAKVVTVCFNYGQYAVCTPDHLFAVEVDGKLLYKKAYMLSIGDVLFRNDLCEDKLYGVVTDHFFNEGRIPVYDIEVEDNHNFFIGGMNGILVHNCSLQVEQFRRLYGVIENVSDRPYVSNSFHCHVSEDITPIQKQDLEKRFWNLCNGGKIQYVKYPISYNIEAIRTLVRRAMKFGYYEGVNLSLAYCDDCGHQELNMDVCPKCGSKNLTKIDRMNGYLAYSRVHGDTRLNAGKMAEIADRVSM